MISTTNGPLGAITQARRSDNTLFTRGLGASSFVKASPTTYLQNRTSIFDQADLKYESPEHARARISETSPRSTITRYEFAGAQFITIHTQENTTDDPATASVDSLA